MFKSLVFGLLMVAAATAVSLSQYLTADDQVQLRQLFDSPTSYKDAVSSYWSLKGLSVLKALPKDTTSLCKTIQSFTADSAESIFALTEAAALIKCSVSKTTAIEAVLNTAIADKKVSSIYYAYFAMKNFKMKVDDKQVNQALDTALKTDDTPTSNGYAFLLASALNMDVEKRYSVIEDVMAQADIVQEKYMQFDGGLFTTSLVVEGAYKLAGVAKKAPTLKPDQVMQLANYLVSRRHVNRLRSAAQLVVAMQMLTTNPFHTPVVIAIGKTAVIGSSSPKVSVKVTDLLGGNIGKVTLTADSGRHIADDAVVLSKKQLAATADESIFELDFSNIKAPFGFYRMQLTAVPSKPDAKLIGLKGSVEFKLVTSIKLENVELGVSDKSGANAKNSKLNHPAKASPLSADTHEKVFMKFQVKSASGDSLAVHQTFVRLTHKETKQEITFVATQEDGSDEYKFELGVGAKEKEFGSLSGVYEMSLLVGDAVVENPIEWVVADIDLTFSSLGSPQDADSQYKPKPIIDHMFRVPEKRPPVVVSTVFTGLVLSPMLIMFVLWLKLGANISNFPMSVSALGFHLGLAAIFALYFMYWTHLNMFETIKYLCVIAVPTFILGHQLLSSIAAKRKLN